MGTDREREREGKGKKGGSIAASAELTEEAVPCGLCGEPLIEGATGDQLPRGSYHVGCIREARRETWGETVRRPVDNWPGRRRRRGG